MSSAAVTVQLKHPISANGELQSEITLRRPTVKELKAFDRESGGVARMATMIGLLAAWPAPAVDAIDVEDFFAVSQVIDSFLGNIPATGER